MGSEAWRGLPNMKPILEALSGSFIEALSKQPMGGKARVLVNKNGQFGRSNTIEIKKHASPCKNNVKLIIML